TRFSRDWSSDVCSSDLLVDLHAVIEVADAVFFDAAVVFQHQQAFHFVVPDRVEQGGGATTHTTLRAGFNRRLEMLVERNTAGVEGFTTPDRAAQGADTATVDTNAGALRYVFHNGAGGGINGIQTVAGFN